MYFWVHLDQILQNFFIFGRIRYFVVNPIINSGWFCFQPFPIDSSFMFLHVCGLWFAAGEDKARAEEAEQPSWKKACPLRLPELRVQLLHPGQRGQQAGGRKVKAETRSLPSSESHDPWRRIGWCLCFSPQATWSGRNFAPGSMCSTSHRARRPSPSPSTSSRTRVPLNQTTVT